MKYPGFLLHGERSMSCAFLRSAPPNLRRRPVRHGWLRQTSRAAWLNRYAK